MGSHHHHHHHSHGHSHSKSANTIGLAFFLNLAFAIIELVGGLLTGSMAILADAVHDFGDSLTLGMAWILQKLSGKKPTANFSYGYARLSLLSSLLAGLILAAGSVGIFIKATQNLLSGAGEPHGLGMLGLAVLGTAVNGFAAFKMSGGTTRNEKMLYWHLLEDVLGWVAVMVGAIVILLTGWAWVDPTLAMMVSLYIGFNVSKGLWQSILLFLQRVPENFSAADLKKDLLAIDGIQDVHDFHAWSIDGDSGVISLHIVVSDTAYASATLISKLKNEVRHTCQHFGKFHVTIEIESNSENCIENCENQEA